MVKLELTVNVIKLFDACNCFLKCVLHTSDLVSGSSDQEKGKVRFGFKDNPLRMLLTFLQLAIIPHTRKKKKKKRKERKRKGEKRKEEK